MAKLNYNEISENCQNIAPIECGMYLSSFLADEYRTHLRSDWKNIGGCNTIPWWKWCYENIKVIY